MNKADNIYWGSAKQKGPRSSVKRSAAAPRSAATSPRWAALGIVGLLGLMLCLTVNFRAFSEYSREAAESHGVKTEIEALTQENLSLQEEIHYLKTDPSTIEREARKYGFKRRN